MARTRTRWVCQECGFQTSRFLGRCTECSTWGSLVEEAVCDESSGARTKTRRAASASAGPVPLATVVSSESYRFTTGLAGLDEVLGGGLVPGSVILLAGDPGIGKSTLLLQISQIIASARPVLYISGEESKQQVKLRAHRLGIDSGEILVDAEQDMLEIEQRLANSASGVAVIDSIQSMYHPDLSSAPGSVSQVRECAAVLAQAAKQREIATIIVGHVTKDGSIAGPRVLEHMVDVVLQFEGERTRQLRILRAAKNRFGSTQEVAIFTMTPAGLAEVDNPSALLLADRLGRMGLKRAPSGTAVIAAAEGARALLVEVQALVGASPFPSPRRVANGWDLNRLLQILAVLEKKVGLLVSRFDVYVNVAGGFDFNDPAGDLGVAVAIATSYLDRSVDPELICLGEIGLTGEVRPVAGLEKRLKEAQRLGFRKALVPAGNLPTSSKIENLDVTGVEFLVEALHAVVPGHGLAAGPRAPVGEEPASQAPGLGFGPAKTTALGCE